MTYGSLSLYEIQNISLRGEYYQCDMESNIQIYRWIIEYVKSLAFPTLRAILFQIIKLA